MGFGLRGDETRVEGVLKETVGDNVWRPILLSPLRTLKEMK